MKTVAIREVTERVSSWNPTREPETKFEYIDLSAVDNAQKAIRSPTPMLGREAPSRARQLIAANDVLVSTVRPNLNAVALVGPELDGATASTGFTVLRASTRLDARYLFHWVRTSAFVLDMVLKATGASYPAVSDGIIKDSLIPLPPLDEQRRIATILDHADHLHLCRQKALSGLERLERSLFVDYFAKHEFERSVHLLGDLLSDAQLGVVRSASQTGDEGPFRYVRMDAISSTGVYLPSKEVRTNATAVELTKYTVRAGDLLFNTRNSRELVGKSAIFVGEPALFNNNILRLRFRADLVTPGYVHGFLWSSRGKQELEQRKSGTTSVFAVYTKDLTSIPVPVPPMDLQRSFVAKLGAVADQKIRCELQAGEIARLMASLQSRAFSGQL